MVFKRDFSISGLFLFSTIFITFSAIAVTGYLWRSHEVSSFHQEVERMTNQYFDARKELIRNRVDSVVDFIEYKRTTTEKRLKDSIRKRGEEAHAVAAHLYRENTGQKSENEIKSMIRQVLRSLSKDRDRGYYFAASLTGVCEFNHGHPELEGRRIGGLMDADGTNLFDMSRKILRDESGKEGYIRYLMEKPHETGGKKHRKIAYVKLFEPLGWVIGAGDYMGDMEKEIQKEVLARIRQIRFGKSGFIFVHTFDGINLSHINEKIVGTDVWNLSGGPDGMKYIQKMTEISRYKGGGYLNYHCRMKAPGGKPGARIGFVRSVPDWEWTVGTGVSVDDIETRIEERREALSRDLEKHLFRIFVLLALLLLVISMTAKYISYKSSVSFRHFTSFFEKAAGDSIRVDESSLHFSEFSTLAGAANRMIEARQKVEEALEETRDNLVNAQRIARMGNWAFYPATGEYYWSDEVFRILGLRRRRFSKDEILDLIIAEDRERFVDGVSRLVNERVPMYMEFRIKRNDGTPVHLHARGEIVSGGGNRDVKAIGSIQDITEIRRTEERLGESEEKFRAITLAAQNAIVMMDDHGRISYWNRAAERIFGYSEEDAVGRELHGLIVPEGYRDGFVRGFSGFRESGRGAFVGKHVEQQAVRKEGTLFPVELSLSGVKINGKWHAVGIIRDMSDRKRARDERERLHKELLQSRKMESLGTLAGGIAHDFNNLLFPIVGYTEMTKNDLPEGNPSRGNLDEVLRAATRARELVRQILTFSRRKTHRQTPVRVQEIIEETLLLLRASLPSFIEIRERIDEGCGPVLGDETQISQIIMNLCTNAFHAMENQGGILEVSLEGAGDGFSTGPERELGESEAGYLRLTVRDTGRGMAEHEIDRIFEPYYSTKDKDKGTGLGLSVVHGIVKGHGGAVDVHSRPGRGTTLTVFLPLMGKGDVPPRQKKARAGMPLGSERILLVDDEAQIAMMMDKLLSRLGYAVTSLTDSRKALEVFRQDPRAFDLLICDLTMPKMTGDRLAGELLSLRSDLPVILCTGYSEMLPDERVEELGIGRLLSKPVPIAELARAVRGLLDQAGEC